MPPIPLDTQELTLLEQYERRLQSLGEQRALLQAQLDRISNERSLVQRQYGLMHNNRVAAIARLPDEMLSEVFNSLHRAQNLLSISTNTSRSEGHRVNCVWRAEAVLAKVCSRWRTIALGMHSLWSIFLCDKPSSCACLVAELARLRTYLQRSGSHDLELFFDFTCPEPFEPESRLSTTRFKQSVQEMLTVAVEHAERWRQITILANDTRRRVPVTPLKADIWAPRLERMVICTGEPPRFGRLTAQDDGWNPQVLLLDKGDVRGPCPALRYLKLDRAGLLSCRPCLSRLTHLVLEYGSVKSHSGGSEFVIEWPALIHSSLLRSPHLESLSLCEKILCSNTFPASPNDPTYYLDFPALKHLRLGSSFKREAWDGMESKLFWFLLRYIAASHLETLEISSFILGKSPWSAANDMWPDPAFTELAYSCKDTSIFSSLQSLTVSDIKIYNDRTSQLGFLLMERMSRNAHTLILSDYQSSLISLLSQDYPFNKEGGFSGDVLWPDALDISINFEIYGRDSNHCLEEYASWCMEITNRWENVQVLRLPPIWIDMWLSRLKKPINVLEPPFRRSNFVWEDGQQKTEEGDMIGGEEDTDDEGEGPWALATYDASIRGHPVRIIPLKEVIPRCWPPGSRSTPFNTLYSEQFEPFNVEVGRVSATGTVYA